GLWSRHESVGPRSGRRRGYVCTRVARSWPAEPDPDRSEPPDGRPYVTQPTGRSSTASALSLCRTFTLSRRSHGPEGGEGRQLAGGAADAIDRGPRGAEGELAATHRGHRRSRRTRHPVRTDREDPKEC